MNCAYIQLVLLYIIDMHHRPSSHTNMYLENRERERLKRVHENHH